MSHEIALNEKKKPKDKDTDPYIKYLTRIAICLVYCNLTSLGAFIDLISLSASFSLELHIWFYSNDLVYKTQLNFICSNAHEYNANLSSLLSSKLGEAGFAVTLVFCNIFAF